LARRTMRQRYAQKTSFHFMLPPTSTTRTRSSACK
jgi:hypothetical protein